MTQYATLNPLGSTSPYDLFDNAQNFDNAVNSITSAIWQDRFGKSRLSWYGIEIKAAAAMQGFGYVIHPSSFEGGATLTTPNMVLRWQSSGELYRWDGDWSVSKVVPAGSTPATAGGEGEGAWVSVGDGAVRTQLMTLGFALSLGSRGNTVWGRGALSSNAYAKNNTIIGEDAGKSITGSATDEAVGAENTILGRRAGVNLTTGQRNILVGHEAGSLLTTGNYNIFIYAQSSSAANVKTGDLNVVIGYNAGKMLTSGDRNTFLASDAGSATTTGRDNVAMGQAAMQNNTTGGGNTHLGAFAGTESGTGNNNLSAGRSALFRNVDGSGNVALGREAALGVSGTGASPNNITVTGFQSAYSQNGLSGVCFYGMQSGYHATAMTDTVLVGRASGFSLTTGSSNVMVGAATGDSETTGSQLVYLGHNAGRILIDGTAANGIVNSVCLGYRVYVSGSQQVQIGNSSQNIYAYSALQVRSDERDKTDKRLIDGATAVSFVRGLESYFYKLNFRDDYVETYEEDTGELDKDGNPILAIRTRILENDGSKTRERDHAGFLAQQVKRLMESLGLDFGMYQDHSVNGGCDVKTLAYEQTIPFITKALDVAFAKFEELETRLNTFEAKYA